MSDALKKLQFASEPRVLVLNAPQSFASTLESWRRATTTIDLEVVAGVQYGFVLSFVTTLAQIKRLSLDLETMLEPGDAKLWLAYPKASSKRYSCEFNRDSGWASLGDAGFEPVRQIAVDDDWSALRFRQVTFIKKLTRRPELAMTKTGKARAEASRKKT
jgi:hypothetical protein